MPSETEPPNRERLPHDGRSFTSVYAEHSPALIRLASRIVSRSEAEDIVHEALLTYWLHPERHDAHRGSLETYLRMATRGRALDRLRSADSGRRRDTVWTSDAASAFGDAVHDRRDEIIEALRRLSLPHREAIVVAFYGDLTYSDAAESLGVPEGTFKTRIRTALARLREELSLEPPG